MVWQGSAGNRRPYADLTALRLLKVNSPTRTVAILNGWPSLLRFIPVILRTSNGSLLVASCPNPCAAQTVEGARGGRTVR